jgi:hypothetical protein
MKKGVEVVRREFRFLLAVCSVEGKEVEGETRHLTGSSDMLRRLELARENSRRVFCAG